jgi:hypothetical protein
MRCEEVQYRFADYLKGEPSAGSAQLEYHLSTCGACRREIVELRGLWERLQAIPPRNINSAGMETRFEEMLRLQKASGMDQKHEKDEQTRFSDARFHERSLDRRTPAKIVAPAGTS